MSRFTNHVIVGSFWIFRSQAPGALDLKIQKDPKEPGTKKGPSFLTYINHIVSIVIRSFVLNLVIN